MSEKQRPPITMSDLRGSEGEWVRVSEGLDYWNAQIVSVNEETGKVDVRLAIGTIRTFHWSRIYFNR